MSGNPAAQSGMPPWISSAGPASGHETQVGVNRMLLLMTTCEHAHTAAQIQSSSVACVNCGTELVRRGVLLFSGRAEDGEGYELSAKLGQNIINRMMKHFVEFEAARVKREKAVARTDAVLKVLTLGQRQRQPQNTERLSRQQREIQQKIEDEHVQVLKWGNAFVMDLQSKLSVWGGPGWRQAVMSELEAARVRREHLQQAYLNRALPQLPVSESGSEPPEYDGPYDEGEEEDAEEEEEEEEEEEGGGQLQFDEYGRPPRRHTYNSSTASAVGSSVAHQTSVYGSQH